MGLAVVLRARVLVVADHEPLAALGEKIDAAADEDLRHSVQPQAERQLASVNAARAAVRRMPCQRADEIAGERLALGVVEVAHSRQYGGHSGGLRRDGQIEIERLERGVRGDTESRGVRRAQTSAAPPAVPVGPCVIDCASTGAAVRDATDVAIPELPRAAGVVDDRRRTGDEGTSP